MILLYMLIALGVVGVVWIVLLRGRDIESMPTPSDRRDPSPDKKPDVADDE
jgi:hypothetical protein